VVAQAPGYQRALRDFNARLSKIRGLHLISDHQTNPLIAGSVYLAERVVERVLDER
jgi:hypothetical protein